MEATPSSGAFTGATLAEKLNKLNASQQSIETLSHWCIFHRKKAKEIVDTWASKFHAAPKEQRVPFLYLANDILQNSRRKGPEFVNAFWTVLSAVLRDVFETRDDTVRNAANRLVTIWEERRVFGSRGQSLREELLGKGSQSPKQEAKQSSSPNNNQVFEGTLLERVAKSYQAAQEKAVDEYGALSKCSAALSLVVSLEKEAENGAANGDVHSSVSDELLEQELVMRQCIEQLESCEKSHAMLCSDLKDALHEQESKLEQLRAQLQTAQSQLQQTQSVQQRVAAGGTNLTNAVDYSTGGASNTGFDPDSEPETQQKHHHDDNNNNQDPTTRSMDSETHAPMSTSGTSSAPDSNTEPMVQTTQQPPAPTPTNPTPTLSTAAEIAAKLTASASSAAMLTSVLSSLAAEEASNGIAPNFGMEGMQGMQKRPRLENHAADVPMPATVPMPSVVPYQLPPHLSQFLGSTVFPSPGYSYHQPTLPPMQNHMMMGQQQQHQQQRPMGPPPPPLPPGCNPMYQFQQSVSPSPYYSPPPLPAPPAPAPRQ